MTGSPRAAVIGAGPAGLMAADMLSERGVHVDVFEAMPSVGRKFLMAGKSGLNVSKVEPIDDFVVRYPSADDRLIEQLRTFGPDAVRDWMHGLGIDSFVGPTGRLFPKGMKASPLLRAWLRRLGERGVQLHTRHDWTGWQADGALIFETGEGPTAIMFDAVVFACGGASWSRLGATGAWANAFMARGVACEPFAASNCGFLVDWSDRMKTDFAGMPVKAVKASAGLPGAQSETRAEFVITDRGVESGGVYALSAELQAALKNYGEATLFLDLAPDVSADDLMMRLSRARGKQTLSSYLRKTARLSGVKLALLYEFADADDLEDAASLVTVIKDLQVPIRAAAPIDEAISTTGGVAWSELDATMMVRGAPGVFCAGEMVDWDAPTGGYLITACLAMGRAAGLGAAAWLKR